MSSLQTLLDQLEQKWQALQVDCPYTDPIQACFFLGEFGLGFEIYRQVPRPTPENENWVGNCHHGLGNRERALEHLMKAVQQGHLEAHIHLALINAHVGQHEQAEQDLGAVRPQNLSGYARALWHEAWSLLETRRLNFRASLEHGQQAWRHIQGTPEFVFAAPRILSRLAGSCNVLQLHQRCLYYLDRAEEICITPFVWVIRSNKAIQYFESGRYEEARDLLDRCVLHINNHYSRMLCLILKSRIQLIFGDVLGAMQAIEHNRQLAGQHLFSSLEVVETTCLAMLHALQGDRLRAVHLMQKAENLISEPNDRLNVQLAQAYLAYVMGQVSHPGFLEGVREVVEHRAADGHPLEHIRAQMFYCEFLLGCRSEQATAEVEHLIELFVRHDSFFLAYEDWIFLGTLKAHLQVHHPEFMRHISITPRTVVLRTINKEEIEFDGALFHIPMKKALEVLVYLLVQQKASITEIVSQVLAEYSPSAARNHFHQIKHMINERLDFLTIAYDRASRRYHLQSDFRIAWDVQPYLEGKTKLDGIILPSSGSDWVIELNQRLSH